MFKCFPKTFYMEFCITCHTMAALFFQACLTCKKQFNVNIENVIHFDLSLKFLLLASRKALSSTNFAFTWRTPDTCWVHCYQILAGAANTLCLQFQIWQTIATTIDKLSLLLLLALLSARSFSFCSSVQQSENQVHWLLSSSPMWLAQRMEIRLTLFLPLLLMSLQ